MKKVFAHLMVRGGGSAFYRKNLFPVRGKPVIQRAIELCQSTSFIDDVFVWSEDREVLNISETLGVHGLPRPRGMVHYCSGFFSMDEWNANRYQQVVDIAGTPGDVHVQLNCNNFLVRPATLEAMYALLEANPQALRVTGVKAVRPGLCMVNPVTGYLLPFWNDVHTLPDEHPPLYRIVGASIANLSRLNEGIQKTIHYNLSEEEGFDFQNEEDVPLAEFYLERREKILQTRLEAQNTQVASGGGLL